MHPGSPTRRRKAQFRGTKYPFFVFSVLVYSFKKMKKGNVSFILTSFGIIIVSNKSSSNKDVFCFFCDQFKIHGNSVRLNIWEEKAFMCKSYIHIYLTCKQSFLYQACIISSHHCKQNYTFYFIFWNTFCLLQMGWKIYCALCQRSIESTLKLVILPLKSVTKIDASQFIYQ